MNQNVDPPDKGRDDVATLLRIAGKRESVPGVRAIRVKSAARAAWQQQVAVRSRRRNKQAVAVVLAAAAAVLLAVGLNIVPFGNGLPTGLDTAIRVDALTGQGWTLAAGSAERRDLSVGDSLDDESVVETAGAGRTAIRLASGHSLRLDESTSIRLLETGVVALERGAIYVDSGGEDHGAGDLEIQTSLGVVHEIGTQFEVRLIDETLRVRLREGAVIVRRDADSHELQAGAELEMNADGSVVRRTVSIHGVEWDWATGIAPIPDLEGLTALEFLDWVARERAWTLAFSDERVARSAAKIVLGGSAARLTLDDALDAVLPTCGLSYRVADSVLVVSDSSGSGV